MKNVAKLLTIVSGLFILTAADANAQSRTNDRGVRFGIGLNGGLTTEKSPFKVAYGADAGFQFDLSRELAITATGGYTRYQAKDGQGDDYNMIPVKGGVKVFPQIGGLYLSSEAGAGFSTKEDAKAAFIYSGGLGYQTKGGFDVGARYEGVTQQKSSSTYRAQNGQFALRVGYNF